MKILHVINSINPCGGGPIESIIQGNREFAPRGVSAELVCVDAPTAEWIHQPWDFPIHAVGPAYTPYRYAPRLAAWLEENLKRFDFAIMHSDWQYLGHALHRACVRQARPYFVYPHGSLDPIHRKVFRWKHPQKWLVWKLFEHRMLEQATGIIYTGVKEKELAKHSFHPPLTNHNALVLPYCTGEPPVQSQDQQQALFERFPALRGKPYVLFLSRVHPKKGVDILLRAFAQELVHGTDWQLVIAGPGDAAYVEQLKGLASELGITERVHWTGMLMKDLKWSAFRNASLFALASHQENFGIAVVEALSCGVPVMITEGINIYAEICQMKAGLAGTDSVEGFAPLLRTWRAMSHEQQQTMRANARTCFEQNFSASLAATNFLEQVNKRLQVATTTA